MVKKSVLALAVIGLLISAAAADTLAQVKKRGLLTCGSNPGLAGFGLPDGNGQWAGLDIDFCRALAAAIFGDTGKVKFVPLAPKDRFQALQSGKVDVLANNTTWTLSRETGQGLLFAGVNYFDGQGFMAHKKLNLTSALELSGTSICVQQSTTTELNLADFFHVNSMTYKPVGFATADEAIKAYEGGRCDVYTADTSDLYAGRMALADTESNIVLPEIISKEPLGPVVRQGDDRWFNIVKWVNFAMVNAEELGVTSKNADEKARSDSPDIRRLLGFEGNFGEAMGLDPDWAYRIVKLVGNYGEVFDRNLGEGSPLKIKRGMNALWSKGGLLYAPPVR
ncbi:MAG: amino acid ABC transporter substrate-binding protein [Beijerinckiaceae bacterium]|nr:amino acid ABC transporter substrate-binding protein [Beijerinckiaceae bacterium]MCI0736608.1 amino acid ABC transporter substrate-binding protein [Beijerinckiaceae bacterium]